VLAHCACMWKLKCQKVCRHKLLVHSA